MTDPNAKADLAFYLRVAREALLWKLDGLSEYDVRRPLTPTGSNLLGLVKHVASVAAEYLGFVFQRPFPQELPWSADDAEPNADLWATPDQSREEIIELYRRAWAHGDATIDALELDSRGHVPWWPAEVNPVTLQRVLVHLLAELNRHAGHADILRELIDGNAGFAAGNDNLASRDATWWADYRARVEAAAQQAGGVNASGA